MFIVLGRRLWCPLQHLAAHEISLSPLFRMFLDEIREEKALQHDEHDEEFDEDDCPQCPPQSHAPETLVIKVESLIQETCLFHKWPRKR